MVAPSGSYRIAPYLAAAQALEMQILVVSNSKHSLIVDVANGITIDFSELDQAFDIIVEAIGSLDIACVLATDDSCVELCSRVAKYLNLPQNSPAAAELTHRKDLGRKALTKAGCNTPDYRVVAISTTTAESLSIDFPVVVKPLGLSASRGVIRADNREEYVKACNKIDAILQSTGIEGFSREHLLVESYIDGAEFAVEGFVINGQFHLLTIFDKPEPLTGPYFEETYYLTPSRLDSQLKNELIDEVAKCCKAYDLEHGPVHAEARISPTGVILLELAARTIGGQCGQLIEFSLQQKLEELVIRGMCGEAPELDSAADSAGVLMIPVTDSGILKRVEGLTRAMQTQYVKDVEIHVNPGYELVPLPEGASYLGFIFAQAPDFERTYAALKNAYRELRFITQPKWELENQL